MEIGSRNQKNILFINFLWLFFVVLFLLIAGCISPQNNSLNDQTTLKENTKEFNLNSYVIIQPLHPYPGGDAVIKYYVENKGTKDIWITMDHLEDRISFTCPIKRIEYNIIPTDISTLSQHLIKPGDNIVFVWKVHFDDNIISNECKGAISLDYTDTATLTKYIHVINSDEFYYGSYSPSNEETNIYENGNIKIASFITPQEPIILSPDKKNSPSTINFEIENIGDGDIRIEKVRFGKDENINMKCNNLKNPILKQGEKKIIKCSLIFKSIPKIEEKYRVMINITYSVRYRKDFSFTFSKNNRFTGAFMKSVILNSKSCGSLRIGILGSIILSTSNNFLQKICPLITMGVTQYEINNIMNFGENVYGYNDGKYVGLSMGRRYSHAFAKAFCNGDIEEGSSISECLYETYSNKSINDECLNTLYNTISTNKVKNIILKPRRDQAYNHLKRRVEYALRTNKKYVRGIIRDVIDKESDKLKTYGRIGNLIVRANFKPAVDALTSESVKRLIDALEPNKEEIIRRYENGFMRGFEKGFKEGIRKEILSDMELYCGD